MVSEWKPIESALKDLQPYIWLSDGFHMRPGYWSITESRWMQLWGPSNNSYLPWEPTHWMPLPEPPHD